MKDVILLSLGYDTYAVTGKPALAGKLLEILSDAVAVRANYDRGLTGGPQSYRVQPRPVEVKIEMVDRRYLVPPSPADQAEHGTVEIKTLTGAVRLLNR